MPETYTLEQLRQLLNAVHAAAQQPQYADDFKHTFNSGADVLNAYNVNELNDFAFGLHMLPILNNGSIALMERPTPSGTGIDETLNHLRSEGSSLLDATSTDSEE